MAKVDVQEASEETVATPTPVEAQAPAPVVAQPRKKINLKDIRVSKRTLIDAALVIAVVALGLFSWTLYTDKNNLTDQLSQVNDNPQIAVEKQTKDLLDKVGALIQLPKGETPTIAAVSDAAKAKKQSAFFANAQNGDKVLMYVKAGQAILYRPSTNKIVLVAPLTFSSGTDSKSKTTDTNKTTNTTNNSTTSN